jgi:hypothetical protein
MLALGILAGVVLLVIARSIRTSLRFSYPAAYEPLPAPLDRLPAEDAAAIDAWGRGLEAKGFRHVGDYRVDLELDPAGGSSQTDQKRVWISPDRTTWAVARRVSFINPIMDGVARAWRQFAFVSPLAGGATLSTHTCRALDASFFREPASSSRVFPGLEDVDLLLEAHGRHARERGAAPEATDGDLPAFERASWARIRERGLARGYLVERDGRLRSTFKLAMISTLRGLSPFRTESGSRAGVAARLLGLAAAATAGAAFLAGSRAPFWAGAALFAAGAVACCAAFPNSHWISWIAVMLPAHAALRVGGVEPGWEWFAGAVALSLVLPRIEGARFRRAAAALSRPDAGPPPLTRGQTVAWAVSYAVAAACAAGWLIWTRSPKTPHPLAGVEALLLVFPLLGLVLAPLIAGSIASLRRTRVKRVLDGLAGAAMLLLAGFCGGMGLAWSDRRASEAAADAVVERLERHRAARGSYPAALAELGPLPPPRCGWGPAAFTYAGPASWGGADSFRLSWPTDRGPAFAWPPPRP